MAEPAGFLMLLDVIFNFLASFFGAKGVFGALDDDEDTCDAEKRTADED